MALFGFVPLLVTSAADQPACQNYVEHEDVK